MGVDVARISLLVAGLAGLGLTAVFLWLPALAEALVPWELSRLSRIFLASIIAASACPVLWIGVTGELAAARAGALDFLVMWGGTALFLFGIGRPVATSGAQANFAVVAAVLALVMFAVFLATRRLNFNNSRPMPLPVRAAFLSFVVLLTTVGIALVRQVPHIFPWPLSPDLSTIYGWIYLGAATYFLMGFLQPIWGNAAGQLIGFLAYDVILLPPFVAHFAKVGPDYWLSLTVYTAILFASAVLAIWYLFIDRTTRLRLALPQ